MDSDLEELPVGVTLLEHLAGQERRRGHRDVLGKPSTVQHLVYA